MGNQDTLSTLLHDLLRYNKNIIATFTALQDSYQTSNDKVVISWEDFSGETHNFDFPSIKSLVAKIDSLQDTVSAMTGATIKRATLTLPDGSIKQIITTDTSTAPPAISGLSSPNVFFHKSNKNFDYFINPLPYIEIDLTGKINFHSKQVRVKTVSPILDTDEKLNYFAINFIANNLVHDNVLADLQANNIAYTEYEDNFNVVNKIPVNVGNFDVINIGKQDNSFDVTSNMVVYTLNTLLYEDNLTGSSVSLKIGDMLYINNAKSSTIFEVTYVDTTKNQITVLRKEGYSPILAGVGVLSIISDYTKNLIVELPVKPNEYQVIFFKGIEPVLNIEGAKWGAGIGISTNSLNDGSNTDNIIDLLSYYNNNVQDVTRALKAIAQQSTIPASEAAIPNTPSISEANFRVEVDNAHKQDADTLSVLKQKYATKLNLDSQVSKVDSLIASLKATIASDTTLTIEEINDTQSQLDSLFDQRASLVTQLSTAVSEINAGFVSGQAFSPEYSLNGFVPIPQPKMENGGSQEVIAIDVQYRYVSVNNTAQNNSTFSNIANADGTLSKAVLSDWKVADMQIRSKNPKTGQWEVDNPADSNTIHWNQVKIPISRGENIEIRARSISEAGYPYVKVYSDWSASVIIPFPDQLTDDQSDLAETTRNEMILSMFRTELQTLGLDTHTQDSLLLSEKYYPHFLKNLGTTALTPEGKPIDAQTQFDALSNKVDTFIATLSNAAGSMEVSIVDSGGSLIQKVGNNTQVNIFAGYYKDEVSSLTVKKGVIVTKIYYVQITNISDANVELLSYVPGSYQTKVGYRGGNDPNGNDFYVPNETDYKGYILDKNEYTDYRRYWAAPTAYMAIKDVDLTSAVNASKPFTDLAPWQSSQNMGQIIYARSSDITLSNDLYINSETAPNKGALTILTTNFGIQPGYVWSGNTIGTMWQNDTGYLTDFCVHVDHPQLQSGSDFSNDLASRINTATDSKIAINTARDIGGKFFVQYPYFMHSYGFHFDTSSVNGTKQLSKYHYVANNVSTATVDNFPRKNGFVADDKYLIGKNTCGAYLFLGPNKPENVWTGSTTYNSGMILSKNQSVKIPIIFQARLTDYYGAGDSGVGRIGGSDNVTNIAYSKMIGLDIFTKIQGVFSFDVKVTMGYAPTSASNTVS